MQTFYCRRKVFSRWVAIREALGWRRCGDCLLLLHEPEKSESHAARRWSTFQSLAPHYRHSVAPRCGDRNRVRRAFIQTISKSSRRNYKPFDRCQSGRTRARTCSAQTSSSVCFSRARFTCSILFLTEKESSKAKKSPKKYL